MLETGFDIAVNAWTGMFLPAKADPKVVTALSEALEKAVKLPAMIEALSKLANETYFMPPSQFAEQVKADMERGGLSSKARASSRKNRGPFRIVCIADGSFTALDKPSATGSHHTRLISLSELLSSRRPLPIEGRGALGSTSSWRRVQCYRRAPWGFSTFVLFLTIGALAALLASGIASGLVPLSRSSVDSSERQPPLPRDSVDEITLAILKKHRRVPQLPDGFVCRTYPRWLYREVDTFVVEFGCKDDGGFCGLPVRPVGCEINRGVEQGFGRITAIAVDYMQEVSLHPHCCMAHVTRKKQRPCFETLAVG